MKRKEKQGLGLSLILYVELHELTGYPYPPSGEASPSVVTLAGRLTPPCITSVPFFWYEELRTLLTTSGGHLDAASVADTLDLV